MGQYFCKNPADTTIKFVVIIQCMDFLSFLRTFLITIIIIITFLFVVMPTVGPVQLPS